MVHAWVGQFLVICYNITRFFTRIVADGAGARFAAAGCLPVSIDYLYDVEEIAGVRPVRAVCEGTAVLRSTSTHSLGVRLEEA